MTAPVVAPINPPAMAPPAPCPTAPPTMAPSAPPTIAPPTGSCAAACCDGINAATLKNAAAATVRFIVPLPLCSSNSTSFGSMLSGQGLKFDTIIDVLGGEVRLEYCRNGGDAFECRRTAENRIARRLSLASRRPETTASARDRELF